MNASDHREYGVALVNGNENFAIWIHRCMVTVVAFRSLSPCILTGCSHFPSHFLPLLFPLSLLIVVFNVRTLTLTQLITSPVHILKFNTASPSRRLLLRVPNQFGR